ncbi:hypothetical protein [Burkholderia sola]|uniref:hypothetical protein n=1 Tax=Burkholderia sola TaxID=2843302 RepID=UPI0023DDF440|nr:hypothetical protein [Burkholderia sola]MDF3086279.1 hypothetical protein [Burkholderia sola]
MLPFDTTLSADTASTVPTDFSADSAEGGAPPAIRHPAEVDVEAEQSSGFLTVASGLALHATLSAGVVATAGMASISARTPVDVRTVLVIDGHRLNSLRVERSCDVTRHRFTAPARTASSRLTAINKKALRSADRQRSFANVP